MDHRRNLLEPTVNTPKPIHRKLARRKNAGQRGMTIVELMVAAIILAVGMVGLTVLFSSAATSANRNKLDTNSTLVAKMVLEQIAAQDPGNAANISLTDCAGTAWTISTVGGAAPNGAGAPLDSSASSITFGGIDFSQGTQTNYSMRYKDCSTGQPTTYDVRWNIINVTSGYTRMITVSAKQYNISNNLSGSARFAIPVTLRSVSGPSQQ
jgi:prepilin-type N-terminal cleavage/methylation domain-containing protein